MSVEINPYDLVVDCELRLADLKKLLAGGPCIAVGSDAAGVNTHLAVLVALDDEAQAWADTALTGEKGLR